MSTPSTTRPANSPPIGDSLLQGMLVALVLTVFQRCSGLVRGVLFCWVMDDADLGLWSLTQSWLFALAPVAVLGITGVLRRYVEFYRIRGQLNQFLAWTLGAAGILTTVASIVLWTGATPFSSFLFRSPEHWRLVQLIAVSLGAVVVFNTVQDLADSLKLLRIASWMRLIHSVGFTLFGLVGIAAAGATAHVITWAFLAATVLASVPGIWVLGIWWSEREAQTVRPDVANLWSRVGRFAAWLWVLNIVANLFEISDRYMVMLFAGGTPHQNQALVGQLHSSRVIPLLLLGIATLVSNALLPYLVTHWERGQRETVCRYLNLALKLAALGSTLIGGLVLLLAPLLFEQVFAGRYNDGLAVLPLTLVYCSWLSLFYIAEDFLYCCEKGRWPTITLALGLAANLLLNALLIPVWGLQGAALATMVGNWLALTALLLVSGRFGWRPGKVVFGFCLLPILLCFGGWIAMAGAALVVGLAGTGRGVTQEEQQLFKVLLAKAILKTRRLPRPMG